MRVSGEQLRSSAIHICVSILQSPSHPGCHMTLSRLPCAAERVLLVVCIKYFHVYMSIPSFLTIPSLHPSLWQVLGSGGDICLSPISRPSPFHSSIVRGWQAALQLDLYKHTPGSNVTRLRAPGHCPGRMWSPWGSWASGDSPHLLASPGVPLLSEMPVREGESGGDENLVSAIDVPPLLPT